MSCTGEPGFKASSLKFAPFPNRNFNAWMWIFYGDARNACVPIGITISTFCCDLGKYCLCLLAYGLGDCAGSTKARKCPFRPTDGTICGRLSDDFNVLAEFTFLFPSDMFYIRAWMRIMLAHIRLLGI
jgi:hypothetical protein